MTEGQTNKRLTYMLIIVTHSALQVCVYFAPCSQRTSHFTASHFCMQELHKRCYKTTSTPTVAEISVSQPFWYSGTPPLSFCLVSRNPSRRL